MMILPKQTLKEISHWRINTTERNGNVYDNVIISFNDNVIKFYPFKRIKYFHFEENNYDMKYVLSIDFLSLSNQLKKLTLNS